MEATRMQTLVCAALLGTSPTDAHFSLWGNMRAKGVKEDIVY